MTKVGLCRVPERTVIFDSFGFDFATRHGRPAAPFGNGVINPTSGFKMW
jgi:hypothetical protein